MSDSTVPGSNLTSPGWAGGGEMGARTRQFDWSNSPVGRLAQWPQSLKTIVRTMLDSRYAMWLGWGSEYTFFYNDAYARMTLGPKHPWALGRSAREVWAEIWPDIGPRAESVLKTGQATWDEGLLLFLERNGFPEETYHTFSYSPVPDDAGGIGGMLCVVTEDTERTIGERRLRTLRELAARTTDEASTAEEACQTAARILSGNSRDLPFVLLYLFDASRNQVQLAGAAGVEPDTALSPRLVDLTDSALQWPFRQVGESGRKLVVGDLGTRFGSLPRDAWSQPPTHAAVLPMAKPGQSQLAGFIVAGLSPRRPLDDDYQGFLDLLAGQVATAVANARAYEEERRRAESLAELDRAKTAFFSNVSHEFRTPLTLMLGPVEDLLAHRHTTLTPSATSQLELVHRNGMRLLRLVNTLLDFSRIEAGRVQAVYQPTDLAQYTADLASNFRSACDRAGLRLLVECQPLGDPVFVDREMWEKVVLNLLSNAFKYTWKGEISVTLTRNETSAVLRVRDTGTGIPAEELPRLFERFHRIENAHGRTHEGSGIGLALVQELVKLHDGAVSAESREGQGTTFTVVLPFGTAHLPPGQIGTGRAAVSAPQIASPYVEEALRWLPEENPDSEHSHPPLFQESSTAYAPRLGSSGDKPRARILVADDNADMRDYIARLLSEQFVVETVPDGEAAFRAATERLPDLVLTDVMMPKLNGFELLEKLRADTRFHGRPVIMLSARAGEESRVDGMAAGADDYLVKPFSARELLARVSAHLQIAQLRRESERAVRESESRLRALVSATSDIIYRMGPDWSEMRSLEGREFLAGTIEPTRSWLERYVHPDDQSRVLRAIAEAVRGKQAFQLEHRIIRDDGTTGWVFSRAVPLLDPEGEVVEWFGAASDVTTRKVAEEKLRESEERLRVTLASIGDAVITTDAEGRINFLNGIAESLTGWTSADAAGRSLEVVFHIINEDTLQPVESPAVRALREGVVVGLANHTLLVRKDGMQHPIDDSAAPVRDSAGQTIGCVLVFRDVSQRRQHEKLAIEQAAAARKLAAIVDSSEDAIISKSMEGVIQSWNAAAERIFGYAPAEALGRPITMLIPPDRLDEEDKIIARIRSGERLHHFDTVRVRKDGTLIPVSLTISPIRDEDGLIVGVSKIARDITDRKRLEDELRQLAAELSEANRRKDEFLATLAHELRNPLAPLRNGLQVLKLVRDDAAAAEQCRAMMERQLGQMVRLIDDLLDVSRISRGKITLQLDRVALGDVVQQALETSRPLIDAQDHQLVVQVPREPIHVNADATRLAQIFSNLLNNSAKYTESGGRITFSVVRQRNEARISVKDNGIGIPAGMLPNVFQMFMQMDHSLERSQGGLGIGLSLVKQLTEMHGGRVEAFSEGVGRGCEFVVWLPVESGVSPAPRPSTLAKDPGNRQSRRILVVDDNLDAATSLGMMLQLMGHDVRTAHDGIEALHVAESFLPEYILLDIGMPKLNGYELARLVRQRPWGQQAVLIALTGWGQEEDRRRSHEAGIDAHLTKPVDLAAVESLLARSI